MRMAYADAMRTFAANIKIKSITYICFLIYATARRHPLHSAHPSNTKPLCTQ